MNSKLRLSDTDLIISIKTNKNLNSAIAFIYEAHFEYLSSLITNNSGSEQDAQDILQEVMVDFIRVVQSGKFREESSVKTFLHSMTRNCWLNELKKRNSAEKRDKVFERNRLQDDNSNETYEQRESKKKLLEVFNTLGDGCKKILTLFYFESLSMKEIVEQTNYENEQVVRNKKHKCFKTLVALVKNNVAIIETLKANSI
ncbi:sigma-70 family RNA polymerase sigma factor [Terrimonas sp.]|uniref:RNA polymerase sigma factor n=1 Tax=Terrimonas sp. TaxID=1914338 RepID=UPI000D509664|nr:sigma-70 family RNA polymerase sigma factor [Terrimonas sp.]PVD49544.1 sigma-70 family RNA polymerase sigma factor [Terrimonas sp.]